jgi:hypothetical protein
MFGLTGYHLHEHLLALWGVPIGEMLDLERLAGRCRDLGRWTFFFTSAPANVHGEHQCFRTLGELADCIRRCWHTCQWSGHTMRSCFHENNPIAMMFKSTVIDDSRRVLDVPTNMNAH